MTAPSRATYLRLTIKAGAHWIGDVSNHAVRVLTVLGVVVGFSVAGFATSRGPLVLAVVIAAVLLFSFTEGAFNVWRESERARQSAAADELDRTRERLVAMRSVLVELEYISSRIDEGPLGDELLPNVEWVRHKDLIASERGDAFVELARAYREADWLNRTRATLEAMDEDEVESLVNQAFQTISEAQEVLGEWENELMRPAPASMGSSGRIGA